MAIAVEFLGDGLIGGLIGVGSAEDEAAAKDESLRCGPGPDERFELAARLGGQIDQGAKGKRHGSLLANREKAVSRRDYGKSSMSRPAEKQLLANWRGIYETDI
jgi:hypothetical protein